jgi:hypothetical protein
VVLKKAFEGGTVNSFWRKYRKSEVLAGGRIENLKDWLEDEIDVCG